MLDATHAAPAESPAVTSFSRRRFGRLAAVALAALALCLALATVAGLRISGETREAERWVAHTLEVLAEARGALSGVQDAETGQRGYLLTREPDYLRPYEAGHAAALQRLRSLRALTSDNPPQQRRLAELEAAVTGKLSELARTVELARRGEFDAALAVVRTGEGQQIMLRIRHLFQEVREEERRLLAARQARAAAAGRRLASALSAAAMLALAVTLGCGAAMLGEVRRQQRERGLLERGAAQLRAALESTSDGVYLLGTDGRFTFLNRRAAGQLAGGRDLLGQVFADAFPDAADQPAWHAQRRCLAEGVPTEADLALPELGRHFVLRAFPLIEGGIAVFFRDVTEERRGAEALAASEARLRLALDAAELGTWAWEIGRGTSALEWDARCVALFGLPSGAAMDYAAWAAALLPEDRAATEAAVARAVDPAVPEDDLVRDYRAVLPDGTVRWLAIHGRAFFEPDPGAPAGRRGLRIIGTIRDATAAHEAEAARRAREARLNDLLATLDLGAFMARDANGTIRFWSKGCERLYGWTAEQAVGRISHDLLRTGFPVPLAQVEAIIESDGAWAGDLLQHARDGREVVVAVRKVLRRGTADQPGAVLEVIADVTAQRRAEAALRESEATLGAVLDALPVGVNVADASGRLVRQNAAHRALWGRATEAAGWQQYGDWMGWWPDTGQRIRAEDWAMARALLRGEVVRNELVECARFGTGERRIFLNNGAPIRDAAGRIVGAVAAELDVTEQRAIEAALAESEARFRALAESIPPLLFETDAAGAHLYVNARVTEYTGLPAEAVMREGWRRFIHPEDLARTAGAWAAALRSGRTYEIEYRLRRQDGAWRWFLGRAVPVRDDAGRILRWVGTCSDIEDQKATEAALREGEARLRLALEAGCMGVWSWDIGTDRLEWDARQFELFGLDPAGGQPSGDEALSAVHPDDLPGLMAAIRAALAAGDGAFSHEFRVVHRDGVRWIVGHGHAVPGPDGRAARMVGLNFDVTDAVQAREVLAREAEQLDRLAEERGRALAATEARLAQAAKMEALGRLAGGIAHDFNNVLQAVQGGIALASKRVQRSPEEVRRYLGLASEAAGRGAAVTSRLLSFARRGELQAEPVAPAPLLAGLAAFLRPVIGPNLVLRAEAAPGLPPLLADKGQLEAVLVNLANNARDAMPAGGALTLGAEAAAVPGTAGAPHGLAEGVYVRLFVADEGEGMPPEVLARVSEPFFTTKQKGKGTGLGLAMARGFAEQSGGGLSIESAPGRGTTVSVWLPRVPDRQGGPPAEGRDKALRAPPPPAGGLTVLLAEDKPEVRAVLAAHLEDQGYSVRQAEDAAAALFLVETGLRPDALVTDLAMPGAMDGLDLLREVRAQRIRRFDPTGVGNGRGAAARLVALCRSCAVGPAPDPGQESGEFG